MACIKKYDLIGFLKKDLPEKEMAGATEHVKNCPECREELNWLTNLSSAVSRTGEIEPSGDFSKRVIDTLSETLISVKEEERADYEQDRAEEELPLLQWFILKLKDYVQPAGSMRAWALSTCCHLLLFIIIALIIIQTPVKAPAPEFPMIEINPIDKTESTISWEPRNPPDWSKNEIGVTPTLGLAEQMPWDYSVDFGNLASKEFNPLSSKDFAPIPPVIAPQKEDYILKVREKTRAFVLAYIAPFRNEERNAFLKTENGKLVNEAIQNGLKWLAKMQDKTTGKWQPELQLGKEEYTIGITALALMSFSGSNETHLRGNYKETVLKGVNYLLSQQLKNGRLNGLIGPAKGNYMYNHGLATLALLDIYSMTMDKTLLPALETAVSFMVSAQNKSGGWGYTIDADITDSSVTGWQVMSLVYAKNLAINKNLNPVLQKVKKWYDSITDTDGRTGYRELGSYPNGHIALTSVGMFCRQLLASSVRDIEILAKEEQLLLQQMPVRFVKGNERNTDYYYYYYGSLAMYQQNGAAWKQWGAALQDSLLNVQQTVGANAGSWEPVDRWSNYGGRFYTTSMAILALESNFRFPRFNR